MASRTRNQTSDRNSNRKSGGSSTGQLGRAPRSGRNRREDWRDDERPFDRGQKVFSFSSVRVTVSATVLRTGATTRSTFDTR